MDVNHDIGAWLFFQPWWAPESPVLVSRASAQDQSSGSWLVNDRRAVSVSLDEIEAWVIGRGGWYTRSGDRLEWMPSSTSVDFEAQIRWR